MTLATPEKMLICFLAEFIINENKTLCTWTTTLLQMLLSPTGNAVVTSLYSSVTCQCARFSSYRNIKLNLKLLVSHNYELVTICIQVPQSKIYAYVYSYHL